MKTGHGIDVYWSGNSQVRVTVSPRLKGSLCGLCGNYDGEPENDWTMGPQVCDGDIQGEQVSAIIRITHQIVGTYI